MSNEELDSREWHWRIDITAYDRSSTLTDEEVTALESLINRAKANGLYNRSLKAVERLLRPIDDALNVAGMKGTRRPLAVRLLMREMHRRRQAFWGWSTAEWVETLV